MTTFNNYRGSLSHRVPNNGYLPRNQPDRASASMHSDDPSEDSLSVLFHGSCPRCFHLHTGFPLTLPRNPTVHTRFRCENCDHIMFGIGRTSTQTTLTSMESLVIGYESARTPVHHCVNRQSLSLDPAVVSGPDDPSEPLTTIAEVNTTPGRSRSTSNIHPLETPSIWQEDRPPASMPIFEDSPEERIAGPVPGPRDDRYMDATTGKTSRRWQGIVTWAKKRLLNRWSKSKTQEKAK